MDTDAYLIDHTEFNWSALLSSWAWMFDDEMEVQPWLMNRFGDLFFVDEDGAVLWLNITDGELSEVGANVDDFYKLLEDEDNAGDWFMMGFVDEAEEAGLKLEANQCYGFKNLPILGGDYDTENVYVSSIEAYWSFCGKIHAQLDGLPEGAEIDIEIPER